MKRGLVFGKFLLHRGHQLMIETALSQVDDLTIVVYDSHRPDDDRMPIERRLAWLRELYPNVENILALEDPLATQLDTDDPAYADVYAEGVAFLGSFDKLFSSERGYERFAELIGAEHVLVDEARTLVPTSGTVIRSDPYAYRGWLDPLVYSSLIERVVFVGTESTGKSTLARRLAEELNTLWTHEFGRELWETQGLQGSFADFLKVARRQREREDAASGTHAASSSATRTPGRRCSGAFAQSERLMPVSTTSSIAPSSTTRGFCATTTSAGFGTGRGRWKARRPASSSSSTSATWSGVAFPTRS